MHTVTISIGRNDGPLTRELGAAVPMMPHRWDAFQGALRTSVSEVYGTGSGVGSWDGIDEETFILIGTTGDVEKLRSRLATLAAEYRQDAIGLVTQLGTDTEVRAF